MQRTPLAFLLLTGFTLLSVCLALVEVEGTADEPVRFEGGYSQLNFDYHDGRLRPAVGVQNFQVMRANRSDPPDQNHRGFTYNHQPMLAYWQGRFFLEYLGAHHNECDYGTETFLTISEDGVRWSAPKVVFPALEYETWKMTIAHQRMGFYAAPNGRLLVSAFYGIPDGQYHLPNAGLGLGRVVREIYGNGSLGPIYFIRCMPHAGYPKEVTAKWFPFYDESPDAGFIEACDALLNDRLITQQWWEEDRAEDGFFSLKGTSDYRTLKALSFFHRKDGRVVGLWKFRYGALSDDEGLTWTKPVTCETLDYDGAKVWGQRINEDAFALLYNPDREGRRYPLVVNTSEDGIRFRNLWTVHGEIPPQRYTGWHREFGPQYVRGIVEGNGVPPGKAIWVTYSVNKEDIWVSRIPVPIAATVPGRVNDDFDIPPGDGFLDSWNLYSPLWAPVRPDREAGNGFLRIEDADPYDYAKAVRVFPESPVAGIQFRVFPKPGAGGQLDMEVVDGKGSRPVRLTFNAAGRILANRGEAVVTLGSFSPGRWHQVAIHVDAGRGSYSASLNGKALVTDEALADAESVRSVERLVFRTGEYRLKTMPPYQAEPLMNAGLPGCEEPSSRSVFLIDDVSIEKSE